MQLPSTLNPWFPKHIQTVHALLASVSARCALLPPWSIFSFMTQRCYHGTISCIHMTNLQDSWMPIPWNDLIVNMVNPCWRPRAWFVALEFIHVQIKHAQKLRKMQLPQKFGILAVCGHSEITAGKKAAGVVWEKPRCRWKIGRHLGCRNTAAPLIEESFRLGMS